MNQLMNQPLIITCGLSGSGKTFSSLILEKKLGNYQRINLGDFREKLGITTYSRKDTPKLLAMAIEKIEENYHENKGSILDANLKSNDLRQCFYDLARHLGIKVILVELICPEKTARERMVGREQISKAENPKEYKVFLEQKKVWQDTLLDLELEGNGHVALLRFNTEKKEAERVEGKDKNDSFLQEIVKILREGE